MNRRNSISTNAGARLRVRIYTMTGDEINAIIDSRTMHWRELGEKHFAGRNDLSLIVLKGHLLLEQLLTALISHYCRPSGDLRQARLQFAQKVGLVKAFVLFPFPSQFWEMLKVINQLRNDFAHELEPKKLEEHLKTVRTMAATHRKTTEKEFLFVFDTDEGSLRFLISFWLGFLTPVDSLIHIMEKSKTYV